MKCISISPTNSVKHIPTNLVQPVIGLKCSLFKIAASQIVNHGHKKNFILQPDLTILSGILHHHQLKNMLSLLYVTYRMGRLTVFITLSASSSRSAELIDFSQMYRVSSSSSASTESEPSCGTLSIINNDEDQHLCDIIARKQHKPEFCLQL